jgi:hypothetical protein
MQEVAPGVLHWTARHPDIGVDVSSHLLTESGVAVDPLLPAGEGPDWLGHPVELVVVSICLHTRSIRDFGVPIRAPRAGLHRWEGRGIDAEPYDDGDELAPGVRAHVLGAIAPDDFMLHIEADPGVLLISDALLNRGEIRFMPDPLMDEPEQVKRATIERLSTVLDELEFDAVLFAHGSPIATGGKAELRAFVEKHA